MSWVFFAFLPPFLWTMNNVIDQMLARDLFHRSAFSFLIISGALTLPTAAVMAAAHPQVFDIPWETVLLLFVGGLFGFAGAWPYVMAIQNDDAASAVPILQTVPVFVYLMGFLLLGETLNAVKLAGGGLVVAGAMVFAWNPDTRKLHARTLVLMLISALIWAAYGVWIRYWTQDLHWMAVMFWVYVAWVVFGAVGLAMARDIRNDARLILKSGKFLKVLLPLLMLQQVMLCLADLATAKAMSIAPTAVQVSLFNGLQPVIIMILCGVFYRFRPDVFEPIRMGPRLYYRLVCVAVMFAGMVLLLT